MFDYRLIKDVEPTTHITLSRFKDKVSGVAKVSYGVGTDTYSVATAFNYTVGNMNSFVCIHENTIEGTNIEVAEEDYDECWYPDFTILGE